MKEIDQLLKMANQIAANFRFHEDGVARVADHLQRFWAPVMIAQLSDYLAGGGAGASDMVLRAFDRLHGERA